jgi:hypothetical protein
LRPTSSRVIHDGIDRLLLKSHYVASGQLPGLLTLACVHMQSTTAHLLCRYPEGAAVRLQHPGTGVMHLGEQQIHDAAREKADLPYHWRLPSQDGRNAAAKWLGQHLG